MAQNKGFTLIELLLVIGVIAILAGIVFAIISPRKVFLSVYDAQREYNATQIENAATQYVVDNSAIPQDTLIQTGESQEKPICSEGTTTTGCVPLDVLIPPYLGVMPKDTAEPCTQYTGFNVYKDTGRVFVNPAHIGVMPGELPTTGCPVGGVSCPTELSGYWKMDESSVTTLADTSGNGNSASPISFGGGGPSAVVAPVSFTNPFSWSFNGTSSYAQLPASASLNLTGPITMSAWIKTAGASTMMIVGGYQNSGTFPGYGFAIGATTNGKLGYWSNGTGQWVESSGTVNDNAWHHVAVVVTGTTATFYKDGAAFGTATTTTPSYYNGIRAIGATSDGSAGFFNGLIDDVRIFNRALSAGEIASLAGGTDYVCTGSAAPVNPDTTGSTYVCASTGSPCTYSASTNIIHLPNPGPGEGQNVSIGCPGGTVIRQISSYYGLNNGFFLCTAHAATCLGQQSCNVLYDNGTCTDPFPGFVKDGDVSFLCAP